LRASLQVAPGVRGAALDVSPTRLRGTTLKIALGVRPLLDTTLHVWAAPYFRTALRFRPPLYFRAPLHVLTASAATTTGFFSTALNFATALGGCAALRVGRSPHFLSAALRLVSRSFDRTALAIETTGEVRTPASVFALYALRALDRRTVARLAPAANVVGIRQR
jgi:hypothetical protein